LRLRKPIQCGADFFFCALALHLDGIKQNVHRCVAPAQNTQHVVHRSAVLRGHNSHRARQKWHRTFAIGIKQTFGFEFAFELLKRHLQSAHTVWLHRINENLVTPLHFVNTESSVHNDAHAVLRHEFEITIGTFEHDRSDRRVFVFESEIVMSACVRLEVGNFALEPNTRKIVFDDFFEILCDLTHRENSALQSWEKHRHRESLTDPTRPWQDPGANGLIFLLGNLKFRPYNRRLMKINTFASVEKQSQMLELLKYGTVMAFVDSRHPSVAVPDYLKGDYQLRLNFDYAFEIEDFRVLPDRLEASLSFNRKNFFCVIPFDAVYLLLNHSVEQGSLFVDSVPMEMLELFAQAEKQEKAKASLHAITPENTPNTAPETSPQNVATPSPSEAPKSEPTKKDTPKKKGHLRLIK
jgi:hypothetical protein